jgi:hypothetical protein
MSFARSKDRSLVSCEREVGFMYERRRRYIGKIVRGQKFEFSSSWQQQYKCSSKADVRALIRNCQRLFN